MNIARSVSYRNTACSIISLPRRATRDAINCWFANGVQQVPDALMLSTILWKELLCWRSRDKVDQERRHETIQKFKAHGASHPPITPWIVHDRMQSLEKELRFLLLIIATRYYILTTLFIHHHISYLLA